MIPQETIDEILTAAKVEEVVGEYVSLKKRGTNYVGLCPFHDEKTPSFYVSPSKEIYKCFGCGKAGNSVRFLMDHEKFTYPEALRFLAKKYKIEVDEEETEEDKQTRDEIASLHIVLSFAEEYYHNYLLKSEEGKNIGLEYLKTRKISPQTIEKFKIGLSPSSFDTFTKEALKNKYKEEFLIASGLSIKTHNGNLIDRFRERIMFPIRSQSGRTIGFGGRTLKKDPKEAKYINSPETKVYNKSNTLFGLDLAKEEIRKRDEIYLVEGYTDVISLHQTGIENTVAALGTSLTEKHLKLLKRYSNNISFIFDGDDAGIKASLRGIDIAIKEELNVKAVSLPEGEDPDSFAKAHPANKVRVYIQDHTEDFIIFKTNLYFDQKRADPIQKADVIRNIVQSISLIPNKLKRSLYVTELSRKLDIDEETLHSELNRLLIASSKSRSSAAGRSVDKQQQPLEHTTERVNRATSVEQEKEVIKLLLLYGSMEYEADKTVAESIIEQIKETEWESALFHEMFNNYIEYYDKFGNYPDLLYFINHERLDFQDVSSNHAIIKEDLSENWERKYGKSIDFDKNYKQQVKSTLYHFELRKYQSLLNQNTKDLKKKDLSTDEIELLQKTHIILTQEINRISKEIKLVIY